MPVVTIQDVGQHDGQEVTLRGWLYNLREAGKLLFPIFRDGTGTIQGVVSLKDQPAAFEALRGLTQESLAARARINRVTLARLERALHPPNLDTLERIARALGVDLVELVK